MDYSLEYRFVRMVLGVVESRAENFDEKVKRYGRRCGEWKKSRRTENCTD